MANIFMFYAYSTWFVSTYHDPMRFFTKQFYCWGSQCCLKCVRLGWDAVSASIFFCLRSCLPTCLPVCQLVLQPGMLCPAPWPCLPTCLAVCQLVLQPGMLCPTPWSWGVVSGALVLSPVLPPNFSLVFVLSRSLWFFSPVWFSIWSPSIGWYAVSASVLLFLSCLRFCLQSCLRSCLHLVFHLSWSCLPSGFGFCFWSGMLRCLVSGIVSELVSVLVFSLCSFVCS